MHRVWGLEGVVVFTGLVLTLAATLLFRYAVWRGTNMLAALVATLLATGASTVHYLARPHIFTILGLTAALWVLERDRRQPTRALWWLVPGTVVWTNLHGGFAAWLACLALVTAGAAWQAMLDPPARRCLSAVRRYGLLTGPTHSRPSPIPTAGGCTSTW